MAAVDILGGLFIPRYRWTNSTPSTTSNGTINDDVDQVEYIIQIPETGNIDAVEYYVNSTVTAGDIDIRLEGVDAAGAADGVLIAANAEGTETLATPDDAVWKRTALDASIAVTQGDYVAVVITRPVAGTFVGTMGEQNDAAWDQAHPITRDVFGTRDDNAPMVGFEYDDGSYPQIIGCHPTNYTFEQWANDDTPDERALRFSLPFASRVAGFWTEFGFVGGTSTEIDLVLYDAADAVLATLTLDREVNQSETLQRPRFYRLTTGILLDANTVYRLAVKPTTTNNVSWQLRKVRAAASMELEDGGSEFYLSTRTDAGAWTDTTTSRPPVGIMIDQIDSAPPSTPGLNPVSLLGGRGGGKQ